MDREILDSRGNPTVEADVYLADGSMGRAAVPSGASTGEHEAVELRDGDKRRYLGKGMLKAVGHINGEIATALHGKDATAAGRDRPRHDRAGRHPQQGPAGRQRHPGGFHGRRARAAAASQRTPLYRYLGGVGANTLPVPMMNIINGGAHADNSVDVQEFMIAPFGAPKFSEALRMGVEVFHTLKKVLSKKGYSTAVGDEGGFAPNPEVQRRGHRERARGHRPGRLQARRADRHLPRPGRQRVLQGRQVRLQEVRQEPAHLASRWSSSGPTGCSQYPAIISIEDGMAEDDWAGWKLLTDTLGEKIQLVGDDLFVTNTARSSSAASRRASPTRS